MNESALYFSNFVREYALLESKFHTLSDPHTVKEFEILQSRFLKEIRKLNKNSKTFKKDFINLLARYNTFSMKFGYMPFGCTKDEFDVLYDDYGGIKGKYKDSQDYLRRDISKYIVRIGDVWDANVPYEQSPGHWDDRPVVVVDYNQINQTYTVFKGSTSINIDDLRHYDFIIPTKYDYLKYVICKYPYFLGKRHFRRFKGRVTEEDVDEYINTAIDYQYQDFNNVPEESYRTLIAKYE